MWAVVQAFRVRDAVDIVLVAAVLYRVLVMFRGTRAVQMLAGLGGLIVAAFLARQLELFSSSWILENFWSVWVLALVVTLVVPSLHTGDRSWWPWTCVSGIALGAIAWWYVGRGHDNAANA